MQKQRMNNARTFPSTRRECPFFERKRIRSGISRYSGHKAYRSDSQRKAPFRHTECPALSYRKGSSACPKRLFRQTEEPVPHSQTHCSAHQERQYGRTGKRGRRANTYYIRIKTDISQETDGKTTASGNLSMLIRHCPDRIAVLFHLFYL